jgi:hypothetical protein
MAGFHDPEAEPQQGFASESVCVVGAGKAHTQAGAIEIFTVEVDALVSTGPRIDEPS